MHTQSHKHKVTQAEQKKIQCVHTVSTLHIRKCKYVLSLIGHSSGDRAGRERGGFQSESFKTSSSFHSAENLYFLHYMQSPVICPAE